MSYENSPACKILATHCAFCNRSLVDAISVETGIGPECRKKHFLIDLTKVSKEAWDEGNKIIFEIAKDPKSSEVSQKIARLEELGFVAVVAKLRKRFRAARPIKIYYNANRIYLETPSVGRATFPLYLEKIQSIPGRQWDVEKKVNTFPLSERGSVWKLLKEFFPGRMAIGPKGNFVI